MADSFNPIDFRFDGLPVFLSNTAYRNALFLQMTLSDIIAILEEGMEPPGRRRRAGVVERCATYRREWVKVVAIRDFRYSTKEECWLIVHVDTTGKP
jgi:hypothetical protein